jgi:elongator complex protein 3
LEEQGYACKCIRCREAGLSRKNMPSEVLKLNREEYDSSSGKEVFLSFDDKDETIYGFLRLRKPSKMAHRNEITENSCIVRELHVFGKSIKIGKHEENSIQHSGLGRKLMNEAEKISREDFDARKILVISAIGTREYYKKLGYRLDGPYMSKQLR